MSANHLPQLLLFVPQSRNLSEGKPRNHNLSWTQDDDQLLRDLWANEATLDNFISQLHRSEGSIKPDSSISELPISLRLQKGL